MIKNIPKCTTLSRWGIFNFGSGIESDGIAHKKKITPAQMIFLHNKEYLRGIMLFYYFYTDYSDVFERAVLPVRGKSGNFIQNIETFDQFSENRVLFIQMVDPAYRGICLSFFIS